MSVLLAREEENKENQKCPLLSSKQELADIKNKLNRSRDTICHINEKVDREIDDDSEAEKLSPLLQNENSKIASLALNMEDVVDAIDDTDTDHDERPQSHLTEKSKNGLLNHNHKSI